MKDEKYNGWTNYATWRVNLEIIDGFMWDKDEVSFDDIADLKEYIKDTVETCVFSDEGGDETRLMADYAHAFLEEVNYHEIAEHVIEDHPELIEGEGNLKCQSCGKYFYGLEGKEDTCPTCLKNLMTK